MLANGITMELSSGTGGTVGASTELPAMFESELVSPTCGEAFSPHYFTLMLRKDMIGATLTCRRRGDDPHRQESRHACQARSDPYSAVHDCFSTRKCAFAQNVAEGIFLAKTLRSSRESGPT